MEVIFLDIKLTSLRLYQTTPKTGLTKCFISKKITSTKIRDVATTDYQLLDMSEDWTSKCVTLEAIHTLQESRIKKPYLTVLIASKSSSLLINCAASNRIKSSPRDNWCLMTVIISSFDNKRPLANPAIPIPVNCPRKPLGA